MRTTKKTPYWVHQKNHEPKMTYAIYIALKNDKCPICGHPVRQPYFRANVTENGKSEGCIHECHNSHFWDMDLSKFNEEKLIKQYK